MSRPRNIRLAAALLLAALSLPAHAFNPQPEPPGSVAIGMTTSQFARVSFVNATDRVGGINPCVCPALLTLTDADGRVLASEEVVVDPGAIGSMVYRASGPPGAAVQVRALVEFVGDEGLRLACSAGAVAGLEIAQTLGGATNLAVPVVTNYLPAGGGR